MSPGKNRNYQLTARIPRTYWFCRGNTGNRNLNSNNQHSPISQIFVRIRNVKKNGREMSTKRLSNYVNTHRHDAETSNKFAKNKRRSSSVNKLVSGGKIELKNTRICRRLALLSGDGLRTNWNALYTLY